MDDSELAALKEALCNQFMLKNLYSELEEEREASATAASEALSMILRLQREKAAEKMEASQYKRMAEERLRHADECIAVLKEVIQQNEMEITSLKYQAETYKQKLSRLGVNIPDVAQIDISEEQAFNGSIGFMDETFFHGSVRRNTSLPTLLRLDQLCSEMDANDEKNPSPFGRQSSWRKVDNEIVAPGFSIETSPSSSDFRQAEELNRLLKGLPHAKNSKELLSPSRISNSELLRPLSVVSMTSDQEAGSCSWCSNLSIGTGGTGRKPEHKLVSCPVRGTEVADVPNYTCSEADSNGKTPPSGVHDIFEVSKSPKDSRQHYKQVLEELIHEASKGGGGGGDSADYVVSDDDWLNKVIMSGHPGSKSSPPRKGFNSKHGLPPSSKTSSNKSIASQTDLKQLKFRLKQLEEERIAMQEDTERSKEQLRLLRNVFKQLNAPEPEIKKPVSNRRSAQENSKVVSIMEAALYFSI